MIVSLGTTGVSTESWPPRLALAGVRQVHLDDDAVVRGERIVQRPAVVAQRAAVDDDAREPAPRLVHEVDQVALVVRLEELDASSSWSAATFSTSGDEVGLGRRAVDVDFALTEQVEVGPVQEGDGSVAHVAQSPIAARTASTGMSATSSTPFGSVEHEGQSVAGDLLVVAHHGDQFVGIAVRRNRRRKIHAGDDLDVLGDPGGVDAAERVGEPRRVHKADRNGLAVAQVVLTHRLECVAERVAVVERGAQTLRSRARRC